MTSRSDPKFGKLRYVSSTSNSDPDHVENSMTTEGPSTEPTAEIRWNFFYLSDEAAEKLPQFQYRGQDLSLLYHYALSPLAAFCVNQLTPRWLAPNSITLIGLIFMITSYLAMWYYVPTLDLQEQEESAIPRWIFLWNGVAMLVYQTLDNMDGKQARKTGSSSPLGLLFDHGIDCINNVFGSANWMIAMMLDPARDVSLCYSILFGPYALFYFATWEEFYTGELILPIFNGPSEGLFGGAILSFVSWWYGPSFWQQTTAWDEWLIPYLPAFMQQIESLRHADLLILGVSIGFVQETSLKTWFVVKAYGPSRTLPNLIPFIIFLICPLVVGYSDLDIWLSMPRTSLHLCSALFVDMTTELMMAHMTDQTYNYKRWMLIPLIALTVGVAMGWVRSGRLTEDFLLMYATGSVAFLSLRISTIIHEICIVLNIWCFDITTPRYRFGETRSPVHAAKKKDN